jgi:hypothetical protein
MNGGKRALTPWNKFVKKVYSEGKSKNSSYSFQEALKDASRRKSEMGAAHPVDAARGTKKSRKSARRNSKRSMSAQSAGTRRRRRH